MDPPAHPRQEATKDTSFRPETPAGRPPVPEGAGSDAPGMPELLLPGVVAARGSAPPAGALSSRDRRPGTSVVGGCKGAEGRGGSGVPKDEEQRQPPGLLPGVSQNLGARGVDKCESRGGGRATRTRRRSIPVLAKVPFIRAAGGGDRQSWASERQSKVVLGRVSGTVPSRAGWVWG